MSCWVRGRSCGMMWRVAIRRHRGKSLAQREVLRPPKEREENQQGNDGSLGHDGNHERATANAAFAAALLRIASDKTTSKRTQGFLRICF